MSSAGFEPIEKGIARNLTTGRYRVYYRDGSGRQREQSFDDGTPIEKMRSFRDLKQAHRVKVAKVHADPLRAQGGGFVRDVVRFLKTRRHMEGFEAEKSHLRTWCTRFRKYSRHAITSEMIKIAMSEMMLEKKPNGERKYKNKTIRHRLNALQQVFLFFRPDEDLTPTPVDYVKKPPKEKRPPKIVPDDIIATVAANLLDAEKRGRLRDGKTRARFLVLATCGKRPCQLMRARKDQDVNFQTRVWDVDAAKNSNGGPLYLNDEMFAAWTLFRDADAWGEYDGVSFAKTLRRNGWPAGIKPYNLRHSLLQTMVDRDVDIGKVQQQAGHDDVKTTQTFYTQWSLRSSKVASDAIDGRFDAGVFVAREPREYDRKKKKSA